MVRVTSRLKWAASITWNLLEMQILGSLLRAAESETLGVGPRHLCLNKYLNKFSCTCVVLPCSCWGTYFSQIRRQTRQGNRKREKKRERCVGKEQVSLTGYWQGSVRRTKVTRGRSSTLWFSVETGVLVILFTLFITRQKTWFISLWRQLAVSLPCALGRITFRSVVMPSGEIQFQSGGEVTPQSDRQTALPTHLLFPSFPKRLLPPTKEADLPLLTVTNLCPHDHSKAGHLPLPRTSKSQGKSHVGWWYIARQESGCKFGVESNE